MNKAFVVSFFGYPASAAKALGAARSTIHAWPEKLPDSAIGRIARLRPDVLRAWWDQEAKPPRGRSR